MAYAAVSPSFVSFVMPLFHDPQNAIPALSYRHRHHLVRGYHVRSDVCGSEMSRVPETLSQQHVQPRKAHETPLPSRCLLESKVFPL